jgi:hypothetical protein
LPTVFHLHLSLYPPNMPPLLWMAVEEYYKKGFEDCILYTVDYHF